MRGRWNLSDQLTDLGDLCLRTAQPCDEHFLLQLFRSSRPHLDQIPMPAEFLDALVQQQYDMQRSAYQKQFPGYFELLILLNRESVGTLKFYKNDRAGYLRLVDIAIVASHQGKGYGRTLLRSLQTLAQDQNARLHLSVDRQNWRAKKLYSALDFRLENTSSTHDEMVWTSAVYAG